MDEELTKTDIARYIHDHHEYCYVTDEVDWGFGPNPIPIIEIMIKVAKKIGIDLKFYSVVVARNPDGEMNGVTDDGMHLFVYPQQPIKEEERRQFVEQVNEKIQKKAKDVVQKFFDIFERKDDDKTQTKSSDDVD